MDDIPQLQEQWERDWRKPGDDLRRFADLSKGTLPRGYAPRVSQLDSAVLDGEVEELLAGDLLQSLTPGLLSEERLDAWRPEILAVVRAVVWAVTVGRRGCTYGADLQNFHFSARSLTFAKKVLHFSLSVGLPWLWARLEREASERKWWCAWNDNNSNDIDDTDDEKEEEEEEEEEEEDNSEDSGEEKEAATAKFRIADPACLKWAAWRALHGAETLVRAAAVANFLVFLCQGKYPTLASRVLRLEAVPTNPGLRRSLLYDQMHRQLFWEGFSEVALLAVQLLRSGPVRRLAARAARRVRGLPVLRLLGVAGGAACSSEPGAGTVTCPICGASPTQTPYRPDTCKHLFCYQCLYAAKTADSEYACPVCTLPVHRIIRYSVEN